MPGLSALGQLSAVVTGANKGIGFEISAKLLDAGVSVVVSARNRSLGEEATAQLQQTRNGHLLVGFVELDVTNDESVAQAGKRISKLLGGKLDILVNNAGTAFLDRQFGRDEAYATVDTNTFGTMRVTRALLPYLEQSPAGRVVNINSIEHSLSPLSTALQRLFRDPKLDDALIIHLMQEFANGTTGRGPPREWGRVTMYHASKVGQMAFTVALAGELTAAGSSVTVVACCPGFCRTDMSSYCYGQGQGQKSAAQGADTPVWLALMSGDKAQASNGGFFTERRQYQW
jgi:carbonyl reductase 1